ncbi:hypothetical protein H9650_00110 [Psychrobacillus sp. Sa2BUA9]|uniref:Uncharacterized protein n=1 Tax=Psychrobacillus faecigallinarum TaxID=2762235 RepID=A0ABR8R408_9BACI|nr:hypothetical protein [Psychrobacillus faecigallinarum]MBD7942514.1 hypothetical protein [Psychrobacillus faecigallinarum]
MFKANKEYAMKTAVELAKVNLESTKEWVHPENVNYFIEEVYLRLTGEKETEE